MTYRPLLLASCLALALVDPAAGADAADGPPTVAPTETAAAAAPGVVQQYCTNIRDAAADARTARQMAALAKAEQHVEERIAELDRRQAEYEAWLRQREAFLARAEKNVVAVYANMRPDAAASQLAILDAETAASVLANLRPRKAGEILNEMEPQRAAALVLAIAGPVEKAKTEAAE